MLVGGVKHRQNVLGGHIAHDVVDPIEYKAVLLLEDLHQSGHMI